LDPIRTIGQILTGGEQRDAIHIAICPVVAAERLHAGQDVGFVPGSTSQVSASSPNKIGVVDPFLKQPVQPEQSAWLFLYPGSITSIRHDWTHPALQQESADKEAAKRAIEEFGNVVGMDYDRVIEQAHEYLDSGHYIHNGQNENYKGADWDGMWKAFEVVTGRKVPMEERGWFFSCSC
jgi:hypothetical protein